MFIKHRIIMNIPAWLKNYFKCPQNSNKINSRTIYRLTGFLVIKRMWMICTFFCDRSRLFQCPAFNKNLTNPVIEPGICS